MTALAPKPDAHQRGAPARFLDTPVWILCGQAALMVFFVIGLRAWGLDRAVMELFLAFVFGIGTIVFSPRGTAMRIRLPLSALLFVIWMLVTFFWARDVSNWFGETRGQLWPLFPLLIAVGMLPLDRIMQATLTSGYLILFLQVQATILDPSSRGNAAGVGIDAGFGWQGSFVHKNGLATVMLLFLIVTATMEHRQLLKRITVPMFAVFIVMSRSSTGLSTALAVGAFALWLASYVRKRPRERTAFAFSWALIGVVIVGVIISSAAVLVGLYGKDLTFSGRTLIWSAAIETMGDGWRWVTGWSTDAFVLNQTHPAKTVADSVGFRVPHLHNGPMEMLFTWGIPGLVLSIAVLGHAFREGWQALLLRPRIGQWVVLSSMAVLIFNFSEVKIREAWLGVVILLIVVAIRSREEDWHGPAGLNLPSHGRPITERPPGPDRR